MLRPGRALPGLPGRHQHPIDRARTAADPHRRAPRKTSTAAVVRRAAHRPGRPTAGIPGEAPDVSGARHAVFLAAIPAAPAQDLEGCTPLLPALPRGRAGPHSTLAGIPAPAQADSSAISSTSQVRPPLSAPFSMPSPTRLALLPTPPPPLQSERHYPTTAAAPAAGIGPWTHHDKLMAEGLPPPPTRGTHASAPPCLARSIQPGRSRSQRPHSHPVETLSLRETEHDPDADPEWVVSVRDGARCREFAASPDMPAERLCDRVAAWLGGADIRLSLGGSLVEGAEPLMTCGVQRHSARLALPRLCGGMPDRARSRDRDGRGADAEADLSDGVDGRTSRDSRRANGKSRRAHSADG